MMKCLIAATMLSYTTAQSLLQNLENQFNSIIEDPAYNETVKGIAASDMGLLNNYGCWCYFEENHGNGRGQPVDELDTYCKTLHDGYECIIADSVENGTPCIPWETSYTSAFGSGIPGGMTQSGLGTTCDSVNVPDTCSAWTCKVEGWFIQQYFLYSTQGGVINASNRHENGFVPAEGCPTSVGVPSDKGCCGTFPARYPFKIYDGARGCCVAHTFNTNMFQCCDDGNIRISCD